MNDLQCIIMFEAQSEKQVINLSVLHGQLTGINVRNKWLFIIKS